MTYIRRLILALALSAGLAPAFAQVAPPVPALPDSERRTSYSISASTCACSVGFALYGDSTDVANWIEVFVNGVRMAQAGNWGLTSATGTIGSIPLPITNAVLTFTAPQTGTIQIVGARRPRRTSQFNEGAGVPTRNFNVVLSDLTAQNREVWDKINDVTGRGLFSQPGVTLSTLPLPSACAGKFLGFDATGLIPQCNAGGAGSGNVVGPVSSVSGDFATWNGTTGALLQDAPSTVIQNALANKVWAGPTSGGAAAPAFRSLVGADLPVPSVSTLGGVQSLTCAANQWLNTISVAGVPACAQPNFNNLAGSISAGQIPAGTIVDAAISNSAAIALSKLATQADKTVVGNVSGGVAVPIALTQAQLATLLTGQLCAPQRTVLITGSGTYTTPTCNGIQANALEAELQGGGGGGAGSGTVATSPVAGTAGNVSTFGVLTANGGGAGTTGVGAVGGTCSGSLGTQQNFPGSDANSYSNTPQAVNMPGVSGANSFYGGAGAGTFNAAGTAAKANTGSGGAGGGANTTATVVNAGGGAAGCHISTLITSPAATISYAIGGTAAGAAAGTSGLAGGQGAAGVLIVTARWQ